jgi:hypothetical protein
LQIREETGTRIDLPAEGNDSDVIVITGKKENAEQAREQIQKIQNEMVGYQRWMLMFLAPTVSVGRSYYTSICLLFFFPGQYRHT